MTVEVVQVVVINALAQHHRPSLRRAFAVAPFLIAYAAIAAGARQWSFSAGFIAGVVLLVIAAMAIRQSSAR